MARYINAEQMKGDIKIAMANQQSKDPHNLLPTHLAELLCQFVDDTPTADVAPRAEVEKLQAECNKWQERLKTECEYTEAITKKKVAREIIGEILSTNTPDVDGFFTIHETELTELKKKYTEVQK